MLDRILDDRLEDHARHQGVARVGLDFLDDLELVSKTNHFDADSVGEALTLIRGLDQQNFMIDNTSYNAANLLVGGRMRIFDTKVAADAATDGGSGEGEIASFTIATVGEGSGNVLVKTYKVTRDP